MQNLRRLIGAILVMICLVAGIVAADSPYRIYVDGVEMQLTAGLQPVEVNNSVLLPMRDLFERLGATVVWDESSQRVFAVKDKLVMILPINNDYAYFNGRSVRMAAQAQLVGERTYVPLRFVSTIFGAGVNYDPVTKRIDITVTPTSLSADAQQRLELLNGAVAATRQISSYTGELSGRYVISLGEETVPVEMQAHMRVGGPSDIAFDYTLSSTATPDQSLKGEVVLTDGKLYMKPPGREWVTQPMTVQGGENALVAAMLAGLAGGDLKTLPLADIFGGAMLPSDEALSAMNKLGLIAGVDVLGEKQIDGRELQGYRLTVDPVRFTYYYSNLAGMDPRAQGTVLDNIQALALACEYWISPNDQIIYHSSIELSLGMKPHPQSAAPTGFNLSFAQRLTTVNQPVEISSPVLATN